jgi:hypothetical protein
VREIFFETNSEAGWRRRAKAYDGDRQYLARFVSAFRAAMEGATPKLRFFICPGEGWGWNRLLRVTDPLKSWPDLEVGWVLGAHFSIRNADSVAFFLTPIPSDDEPDGTNSSEALAPAAPYRIIFQNAHDEQEILDFAIATYPHLRALEIRWPFLPSYPPIPQENALPPHVLSNLLSLSWVIEVRGDHSDSRDDAVYSSPPDSPVLGLLHVVELDEFLILRLEALDGFLAQFPKDNIRKTAGGSLASLALALHL